MLHAAKVQLLRPLGHAACCGCAAAVITLLVQLLRPLGHAACCNCAAAVWSLARAAQCTGAVRTSGAMWVMVPKFRVDMCEALLPNTLLRPKSVANSNNIEHTLRSVCSWVCTHLVQ